MHDWVKSTMADLSGYEGHDEPMSRSTRTSIDEGHVKSVPRSHTSTRACTLAGARLSDDPKGIEGMSVG